MQLQKLIAPRERLTKVEFCAGWDIITICISKGGGDVRAVGKKMREKGRIRKDRGDR